MPWTLGTDGRGSAIVSGYIRRSDGEFVVQDMKLGERFYLRDLEKLTPEIRAALPAIVYVSRPSTAQRPLIYCNSSSGPYTFSDHARALIESLEPNVHTWHDMEARDPRTDTVHGVYSMLVAVPRIDCVNIDATEWGGGGGRAYYERALAEARSKRGDFANVPLSIGPSDPRVFFAEPLRGRHLWRLPPYQEPYKLFVSDELAALMKKRRVGGLEPEARITLG